MSNIVIPNTPINTSNEKFHAIWKLTRGLLAAGWRYKASADGNQKETTGVSNLDLWSVGGYSNLSTVPGQTGNAASLLTVANGFVTVQGLTGMTASSVGRALTISGDLDSLDNGTFRIASFISASSVTIYNPNATTLAITGATNASPIVITVASTASLSTGQQVGIFGVLGNTAANGIFTITVLTTTTFSLTGSTGNGTYTSGGVVGTDAANGSITWTEKYGGAAASITAVTNGIATVTGLTGMTANSVGHRLTIIGAASAGNNGSHLIVAFVSATSVKISNTAAVAPDTNNGSINWVERDPTLDVYPASLAAGAWFNLQGPSTLKVPIGTSNPSPAFTRGEKVTQAATGTEAEVLGVVVDTTGGTGFMVLAPRVNGSGAGVRGWDQSIITAQSAPAGSGASVTPSAAILEYVREIVWWKASASTGHMYYQCIDQAAEATPSATGTGRFSTMATSLAQVTAAIPPGGSSGGNPATNGFPTFGTMCVVGTGGAGAAATGPSDLMLESSVTAGFIHVLAANNIESTGVSQDGSWTLVIGTPSFAAYSCNLVGFMRLDDCEDGDLDPYVLFFPTNLTAYTRTRASSGTANTGNAWCNTNAIANGSGFTPFLGFRRRGFSTGDTFQEFSGWILNVSNNVNNALGVNFWNPDSVACTFSTTPPRVREPIFVASVQLGQKMRKGYLRWWFGTSGGNSTDTMDSKKWVQFDSQNTTTVQPVVVGPWDGVTIPYLF